ncbi:hypothetical protein CCP4SC76_2740005 [Gammaproteobacteria bacterium]
MKTQTSYLLPKDTLDSLRTLAKDVGNMSGALSHAIDALETSLSSHVTPENQSAEFLKRFDDLASSLGQLSARVAAVESRGAEAVKAEPVPASEPGDGGGETPQVTTSAVRNYPPEVRQMAVGMRRQGNKTADIIQAIHNQCGYAPDSRNLQKRLDTWEKEPAEKIAPPTEVAVSRDMPAPHLGSMGESTPQADATPAQDKKTQRFAYPPEVRQMAVGMRKQGEATDAILSAIQKACGQAPGRNNLPKMLSAWGRELEPSGEPVAQEAAPSSTAVDQEAPVADTATAAPDKKGSRHYSPEVQKLAVGLKREGKKPAVIIAAIQKECGHAPDKSNLARILNRWKKEVDASVEPVAQEAVSASITVVAQEVLLGSGDAENNAPQTDSASATPDKKSSRLTYPADVRKLAVDMRRKGKKPGAIIVAINKKCGYAPDEKSLNTVLNRWEKSIG